MISRKAGRFSFGWKKSLSLVPVLTAVSATAALAATTTVIIGSSGNDTINESGKTGTFHIYGLVGKDTITGGQGDNLIVGDGHCPPGATDDQYCDIEEVSGDAGDTLRGGGGNNAIFGGGGPNVMYGGAGSNYIEAGPSTNVIYGGQAGDVINAREGSSTVYAGKGQNFIDARGAGIDHIYCSGTHDTVYADLNDVVKNCATVHYGSSPDLATSLSKKHAKKHKSSKRTRKHHR
jgi:Ca2+-binding RTX toxin-like protein